MQKSSYDEMFVWANTLLEDQKHLPVWLASRFPLVILDEVQDTFEKQASFLNAVFPKASNQIVVQRVGDPNQEIFDLPDTGSRTSEPFPDPACLLEIPNSYRFGPQIGSLASPFAVRSVGEDGLSGIGPKGPGVAAQECKHAIFVFLDNSTEGVLEAFGKHALSILGNSLVTKGTVVAVGHIHQDDPAVISGHPHYPKSVGHYWNGYAVEISRKDPNPRTLAQYVRAAQGLAINGRALSPGVEKIASATIELARLMGEIGDLKRKPRTHRVVLEALEGDVVSVAAYRDFLKRFLVEKIALSEDAWAGHAEHLTKVAGAICHRDPDTSKAKRFLAWPRDDPSLGVSVFSSMGDAGPNVFRVNDSTGTIDIRMGSIHSVKGQTHLATLLLSTYWHDHSVKRLMPWLMGKKANGEEAGKQDRQRLLHIYVAMTRPSHLLCIAAPRSALGGGQDVHQNIAKLKGRGWHVAEIVDGVAQWRS